MHSPNNKEDELRRREQELLDRERALRLKELEAELHQVDPPLHKTVKHEEPDSKLQQWYRKAVKVVTFLAIVVGVIVAVRIASVLATALIVGGIAFAVYKVFFESDRQKS